MENKNNVPPSAEEELKQLAEQERIRREKLARMQSEGNNPYAKVKYDADAKSEEIKENFEKYENKEVSVAGRLMSKRVMGKASFSTISDRLGRIQIYLSKNDLGEEDYTSFKKDYDVGDIVGIKGFVFKTQTGEITVHAQRIEMLSKALRPLPEKFHGLVDVDMKYRQRDVDLIMNQETRNTFFKRTAVLRALREYLDGRGFTEVETPVLLPIEIGADARPFKTHHNALDIDMYMRIETELYLKRLIVGGLEKVYEVGRIFRNEGMDSTHNPEFTSIELYEAYKDYKYLMDLVEDMYKFAANKVCGTTKISYQGVEVDLGHWERLSMAEAVERYSGVRYADWKSTEDALESARAHRVELSDDEKKDKGHILSAFFDAFVEEHLVQPTFIYDYPVEISPLAKRKRDDPSMTERFEYFICGHEYGNAFSELNDPIDQRERMTRQAEEKRAQGANAQVDEEFIAALEYGMPPTGGLGFGVDRLVMLLTDSATIRDVLLFPTMKPKKKP